MQCGDCTRIVAIGWLYSDSKSSSYNGVQVSVVLYSVSDAVLGQNIDTHLF